MKIVVMTTETYPHTFFVREINKIFPIEKILVESVILRPPFESHHSFEEQRDDYEKKVFFDGKNVLLKDVASVKVFGSVNDTEAIKYLQKLQFDIVIVFGTGKVSSEVIRVCSKSIVNLHGGDPEEYRGLDSHLWAVYHKDFASLITTLHHLNESLDDGSIILQCNIPLTHGMLIHELRRYNTEICIKLVLTAIKMYQKHGHFVSKPQRKCGRYYSFMPSVLKEICKRNFEKYTSAL